MDFLTDFVQWLSALNPLYWVVPIIVLLVAGVAWHLREEAHRSWVEGEIEHLRYRFGSDGRWDRMCKFMAASMACKTKEEEELVLKAKREVDKKLEQEGQLLGILDERGILREWYHPCWAEIRATLYKTPKNERVPRPDYRHSRVSEELDPLCWDTSNRANNNAELS